jgi:hypothetical protein
MSKRKLAKAHARWEAATRTWAADTARAVLRAICNGHPLPLMPYRVGAVLAPGEQLMAEVPAQIIPDVWGGLPDGAAVVHPWLITTERILGRLGDGRLAEWRWHGIVGCRVDLTPGAEVVSIDLPDGSITHWTGPGVAPLAIIAIARLYGPSSLLDHPGLTDLRVVEHAPADA